MTVAINFATPVSRANGAANDHAHDPCEEECDSPVNDGSQTRIAAAEPLYTVLDTDELFTRQADAALLVPGLGIAPGAPTGVFGQGYVGKTAIVVDVGLCVAMGSPVWGIYPCRRGRFLICDYEMGKRQSLRRFQRLARGRGLTPESLRGQVGAVILPRLNLTTSGALDHFCQLFDGYAIAMLDALKGLTPGVDENSSEIRDYMGILTRASEKTGCVPVLTHHAGKTPSLGDRPRKEMGRGSSGIYDECQTVFVITGAKGEPKLVSHEKDRERGGTVDDFKLRIDDVEVDGDPKAGLRIVAFGVEAGNEAPADGNADFEKIVDRVRDLLRAHPGLSSVDEARERLAVGKPKVQAAWNHLKGREELDNLGTAKAPRWHLKESK